MVNSNSIINEQTVGLYETVEALKSTLEEEKQKYKLTEVAVSVVNNQASEEEAYDLSVIGK